MEITARNTGCVTVTDKHLERLKVTNLKLADGRCWSLKPRSDSREAGDNLTERYCISGYEMSSNEN